jgi:gliding motility-associated-like protein
MVEAFPQPVIICEGDAAAMTFTASGACTTGNWEFQVNQGATVIQAWSASATFNPSPTTTTIYTVTARCSACPAITEQADFTVEVLEEPTVTGTTLVCSGTSTTLTATGGAGPFEWYDAATGGNLVSASGVYTTPTLTSDATYWVSVSGTSATAGSGGSVLITECGLAGFPGGTSADYIEISNLYTTPVNTTGWVVALSQSYSVVNSTNTILWNLPSSFAPCSILSKTDVSSQPNYWGNNILWNPGNASWAIVIDNFGNVVDFVAWGYTAAQLAAFSPTINGFPITLGAEWTGNGFNWACGTNGGAPFSISRIGNADNNNATDFICQPTSLNVVNPSLLCGWTANAQCRFPTTIDVDIEPTASNPVTVNVECVGDVPAVDITNVTDEADDYTPFPVVTFVSDVSDGLSCPETITRTYRVTDDCLNFVDVQQLIIIQDTQGPVMDPPPIGLTVECIGDIPAITSLGFTDNCDSPGTIVGNDGPLVGGGCGGTVTRTWIAPDACGNTSVPVTQVFTVMDMTPPTAGITSSVSVQCFGDIPVPDGTVVPGISDNCVTVPTVTFVGDVSDGLSCPETITRTYAVTDECGNQITVDQTIVVNDITSPTASNPATVSYPLLSDVPVGDPSVVIDEADNCGAPTVTWISDVSDNDICAGESITRTFSVADDCGNEIFVTQLVTIDPLPVPIDAGPDQIICEGGLTTLTAINPTGAILTWSPSVPAGLFNPAATETYTVTANFNGCIASDVVTIIVEAPPVVSFIADVLEGCEPLEVTFINTSTAASGIANCDWTMNGEPLNGCGSVTYTFPLGGTYDVTLTTTSVTGCISSETYTDYIYVESTPVANFGLLSSEQLSTLETGVDFMNTSVGAVNYEWNFDDNSAVSFEQNPSHEFPTADGGYYSVQLVAISPLGCSDTTWAPISVDEELLYFVPNTFTPDDDAYNQYFKPIFTAGFDPYDFNLKIFNRWGEVVWESNDATAGWDGTYGGKLVQNGTYSWVIEFKTAFSDERKRINGHVNVMR